MASPGWLPCLEHLAMMLSPITDDDGDDGDNETGSACGWSTCLNEDTFRCQEYGVLGTGKTASFSHGHHHGIIMQ